MSNPTDPKKDPEWSPAKAYKFRRCIQAARRRMGNPNRSTIAESHLVEQVIVPLRQAGWTFAEMEKYAKAQPELNAPMTHRRYRQAYQKVMEHRRPKDERELAPDVQAMKQWSFEAFRDFFLRYSPHSYFPKHVEPWVKAFLKHRRLMLNVPPGHAKSEFFMIWIPTWLICRDRDVQILLVSNASEDASNWAMEVAGQLESNAGLIEDFGRFAPETSGDQKWQPTRGTFSVVGRKRKLKGAQFTMESRGMGSRVLGRRADFVIVDDPTKQEDAASPTTRDQQVKHLRQQVFTRAEPEAEWAGGRIMVIGQRVHIRDLYGVLEAQTWEIGPKRGEKAWHVEKYPAVLDWGNDDPDIGPVTHMKTLWPERWNRQEIEQAYTDVGGHGPFLTMYQQTPVPEGTALIQASWLEACKDRSRPARQGPRVDSKEGFLPLVRVLAMDPSPTQFNGFVVGDLLWNKDQFYFFVTEVHRHRAGVREAQVIVDGIIETAKPDYFIYETSTVTRWLRDDPWFVNLEQRVRVLKHTTGVNKNVAEYGVQSLAGDFEAARLSFPYGDDEGRRMTDLLGSEALMYPDGDTDDLLMALWFIKFNYKKLRPRKSHLPGHFDGRPSSSWSFIGKEDPYKKWQREKTKRKELLSA